MLESFVFMENEWLDSNKKMPKTSSVHGLSACTVNVKSDKEMIEGLW